MILRLLWQLLPAVSSKKVRQKHPTKYWKEIRSWKWIGGYTMENKTSLNHILLQDIDKERIRYIWYEVSSICMNAYQFDRSLFPQSLRPLDYSCSLFNFLYHQPRPMSLTDTYIWYDTEMSRITWEQTHLREDLLERTRKWNYKVRLKNGSSAISSSPISGRWRTLWRAVHDLWSSGCRCRLQACRMSDV